MKVLIWFLCMLIPSLLMAGGVMWGFIETGALFCFMLWLARTLCRKWDKRRKKVDASPVYDTPKTQFVAKEDSHVVSKNNEYGECVEIDRSQEYVLCPKCGTRQLSNRKVCYNCEIKFE